MNRKSQLVALNRQDRGVTVEERGEYACRLAKQLEKAGEYESAYEALAEFWPDRQELPRIGDLDERLAAEVYLRAGVLAGCQGSANQIVGSQESAKDLITRSIEIFEALGNLEKLAEARADLAICYWREGSYDEARIHLSNGLTLLGDVQSDLKAILLIRSGIVEVWARRFNEALRLYNEAAPLVERSEDHALKGSFHIEFGLVFRRLAAPENREDYLDRALIEYAAASFHFEQAGNERYLARVENNLGYLFFTIGRYKDAYQHLDRARHLFMELSDVGTAAQVDETRARIFLAEGRLVEAERIVRSVVKTLEKGGEQAVLADALTTYGVVLARLGHHPRARVLLERAIGVAETTGDLEGAGRAKLSIIEELGEQTSAKEMVSVYKSAAHLLERSQDPAAGKRLFSCADKVIEALEASGNEDRKAREHSWEGFSFKQQVLNCEEALIERGLEDAGGSVTKAARLLGMHHQSLVYLINARHKGLLKKRSVVRKRRRHIFSAPRKIKTKIGEGTVDRAAFQVSVLHIEDNEGVARVVADTLAPEGMHVDSCASGTTAMKKLKSDARYDLIIVDNDLPGLKGLELVSRMRSMPHRRNALIVMLAGDDCENAARKAGADVFLAKPGGIEKLSSTIMRLLEERKERGN